MQAIASRSGRRGRGWERRETKRQAQERRSNEQKQKEERKKKKKKKGELDRLEGESSVSR